MDGRTVLAALTHDPRFDPLLPEAARMPSPISLDLGVHTPRETAGSIAAEGAGPFMEPRRERHGRTRGGVAARGPCGYGACRRARAEGTEARRT
ncbi:hypothetical protein [Streptomyces adonidis]|uniref:hypothetical protein n=1 Tax=Streptomyces adonidis TaxID=3231367 RepID=UPI0034DB3599